MRFDAAVNELRKVRNRLKITSLELGPHHLERLADDHIDLLVPSFCRRWQFRNLCKQHLRCPLHRAPLPPHGTNIVSELLECTPPSLP